MTIVEADAREINDSRHKLPSESVVRAHKQIQASELRMTARHQILGPVFVGEHSRRAQTSARLMIADW